jgi:hypothetical protein
MDVEKMISSAAGWLGIVRDLVAVVIPRRRVAFDHDADPARLTLTLRGFWNG